jgi:hypothetical protein
MLSLNLNGRRVKAKYYWAQKMIFLSLSAPADDFYGQ